MTCPFLSVLCRAPSCTCHQCHALSFLKDSALSFLARWPSFSCICHKSHYFPFPSPLHCPSLRLLPSFCSCSLPVVSPTPNSFLSPLPCTSLCCCFFGRIIACTCHKPHAGNFCKSHALSVHAFPLLAEFPPVPVISPMLGTFVNPLPCPSMHFLCLPNSLLYLL